MFRRYAVRRVLDERFYNTYLSLNEIKNVRVGIYGHARAVLDTIRKWNYILQMYLSIGLT